MSGCHNCGADNCDNGTIVVSWDPETGEEQSFVLCLACADAEDERFFAEAFARADDAETEEF